MAERTDEDVIDELALRLATLVANPTSVQARRAARESWTMWRDWKQRRRLREAAEAADAESRARPGYRADLEA